MTRKAATASEMACRSSCPAALPSNACNRKKRAASAHPHAAAGSADRLHAVRLGTRAASVGTLWCGMFTADGLQFNDQVLVSKVNDEVGVAFAYTVVLVFQFDNFLALYPIFARRNPTCIALS
jgi:hypothetical protein